MAASLYTASPRKVGPTIITSGDESQSAGGALIAGCQNWWSTARSCRATVLPRHRPREPPLAVGSKIVSQVHGMQFVCFYISRGTQSLSSSSIIQLFKAFQGRLEPWTLQSVQLGAVMAQTGVMQRPWLWIAIVVVLVLQSANARLLTENNTPAVAVRKDEAATFDVLDLSAGRHLLEVEAASEDGATSEVCMFEHSSLRQYFTAIRFCVRITL